MIYFFNPKCHLKGQKRSERAKVVTYGGNNERFKDF